MTAARGKSVTMLRREKAFAMAMAAARPLEAERVALGEALGRVLAEDVPSDVDMPPFNKSAMDGYACRRADLDAELTVVETIKAGDAPARPVGKHECSKIMTGAMVPEDADCVIMVEHTEETGEGRVRYLRDATESNICVQGEDVRAGDVVLRRGCVIKPQHMAVLAAVGCVQPMVARRPDVGVIATGDELTPPDVKPDMSHIRDSNSTQLAGQATAMGAVPQTYGIVRDEQTGIDDAIQQAMADNDVLLISGGVSMGDYDFVPEAMERNGIEIRFDRVAMKPGKPTTFGVWPDGCCFGLPGNPVSTFVQFEVFVKPFLFKLMGAEYRPVTVRRPLAGPLARKRTERESWLPVTFDENGHAVLCRYHGSAHIAALTDADGLIAVPIGLDSIEEGVLVDVRLIP